MAEIERLSERLIMADCTQWPPAASEHPISVYRFIYIQAANTLHRPEYSHQRNRPVAQ